MTFIDAISQNMLNLPITVGLVLILALVMKCSRDGQPIHPLGLASHEVVDLALDFGDRDRR
jgi:hypothetical protein